MGVISSDSRLICCVVLTICGTAIMHTVRPGNTRVQSINSTIIVDASTYNINKLKHWRPDWADHENDLFTVLKERRKTISERCESMGDYIYPARGRGPDSDYLSTRTLALCLTAKAGSKFLKEMIRRQRGRDRKTKMTGNESKETFVVSRNPWHRLVSAWSDKFNMGDGFDKYWERAMCGGKTWPTIPPFSAFVEECVLKLWKKRRHWNNHWAPVIDRCRVCDPKSRLKYTYIIAAENMSEELVEMMEKGKTGIKDARDMITGTREKSMRKSERLHVTATYQLHYQNVSSQNIEALRKMYAAEIYLFGYPDTPFVDFERS